jgi:hypothetical protein
MLRTAAVCLALALWAVQDPARATWRIDEAPADLRPAVQQAEMLILELQGALLEELTRTLQTRGESGAMRSCHLDAIAVTQRVGRQMGIAIGRTGDRLRNPTNAPRPWAAPLVAQFAGARAADVTGYVVDLGDHVGVLKPIATGRMCLGCHGPSAGFSHEVRAELKDRYPVDRAVDFREGDLRGWFWVEVPRAAADR